MAATNALLVFCEGPHDVAFVRQVFKHCLGAEIAKGIAGEGLKFSEYPAPFNQLFRTAVEKHAAKDLSLDMAHKFFLPDRTLIKDDWMILLFNSGGKNQTDKVKQFLQDFLPLLEQADVFPSDAEQVIREAKYLFLYDADHQKVEDIADWAYREYAVVEDTTWKMAPLAIDGKFGSFDGDKGLYVWANLSGSGTLEEIVLPIYESKNRGLSETASDWVDKTFSWDVENSDLSKSFAERGRRKKAILTICGQRKKPGGSLNVILDQAGVLGEEDCRNNGQVADFVQFLSEFTAISI